MVVAAADAGGGGGAQPAEVRGHLKRVLVVFYEQGRGYGGGVADNVAELGGAADQLGGRRRRVRRRCCGSEGPRAAGDALARSGPDLVLIRAGRALAVLG
jgi:hypothetical protein